MSIVGLIVGSVATLFLVIATAEAGECADGIQCSLVTGKNLSFSCRLAGWNSTAPSSATAGAAASPVGEAVILLHGFPEWSAMFADLMRDLAAKGYRSVACNQRGYSQGAKPDGEGSYFYDLIVQDVWDVADNLRLDQFHLVAHDHGALVGWVMAASPKGKARILSYSALSVPHADAFSDGLFGPTADLQQQIASQYFTMFTLNQSASLHSNFWYHTLKGSGDPDFGGFESPHDFQKALWWYNGAEDAGYMAHPPLMSAWDLLEHNAVATAGLRELFGGTPNPGKPSSKRIGYVSVPTLFVCGEKDTAILCSRDYSRRTSQFVTGTYTFLSVDCGHDLLACSSAAAALQVKQAIMSRIMNASASHPRFRPGTSREEGRMAAAAT